MRKKYIVALLIVLIVIAGIIVGILISKNDKIYNLEPKAETEFANNNQEFENNIQIVTTSNIQQKTSPNSLFIFQTYYKECKDITVERIEIPKECINLTEEDLKNKYKDYKIKEFSSSEVTFYQEKEGMCSEHYVIRENNGYVAIYTIDSYGKETLKETTEIVTLYLPDTDRIRLKEGIKVNGREELNLAIEDYE